MNTSYSIDLPAPAFREAGHRLVDVLAGFFENIRQRPVTRGEDPATLKQLLAGRSFPEYGLPPGALLSEATDLLLEHSLFNGHPRFQGYITAPAAPVGVLADFLASAINQNMGLQVLSPLATEIEKQTVGWLADFIGLPPGYGGLLVSGGNMANFTAFLAARQAKAPAKVKEEGLMNATQRMMIYCSKATHTWIDKAAVLFGHGKQSIRWIPADRRNCMDIGALEEAIREDRRADRLPFLAVGNAGDVSTGAVDDLESLAAVCRQEDLWFHLDGAYGMPAAVVPDLSGLFRGMEHADSIAMDPHKWLYCPLEAGCTLVKDPACLPLAFGSHPEYYALDESGASHETNFFEYGFQNSRGFRALKVWLMLQQVGRSGYRELIQRDIALAESMHRQAQAHPELEAGTRQLSIATLRYVPERIPAGADREKYLNRLNEALVHALQRGGRLFVSNAILEGDYFLRACFVNFRTSEKDVVEMVEAIVQEGRRMASTMQVPAF